MPVSRATARMLRPSPKIQPRIFIAVSITNTCSSSVPKRTDVNNAGGSVLDDHNPPKWVTFACRFTVVAEPLDVLRRIFEEYDLHALSGVISAFGVETSSSVSQESIQSF